MAKVDEMEFSTIFSKNLSNMMESYGYTQTDIASKIGVSVASVSYWVSGEKIPRMGKVDKLCELFNCRRSDLISTTSKEVLQVRYLNLARELQEKGATDADIKKMLAFYDMIKST